MPPSNLKLKDHQHHSIHNQYIEKGIRRRRQNRNDGILRLAVTDNLNVLRDRLQTELRRRQQQFRENVQNRLEAIG